MSKKDVVTIELISYSHKKSVVTLMCNYSGNLSVKVNDKDVSLVKSGDSFRFNTPLDQNARIYFYSDKSRDALRLSFEGAMSKLSDTLSYWTFGEYQATHNGHHIHIMHKQPLRLFVRELTYLVSLLLKHRAFRATALRLLYWFTKPILGPKNIWLFADKIYKAGDNAEYLYDYSLAQHDSAVKYYVLSDGSPDAQRFHDEGKRYVSYKSLKQRLVFLHASILVFTHNNAPGFYRFGGGNDIYFRGLFNYDVMYLQHGLAVQHFPELYKKQVDDIKQFFIASRFEKDNLLSGDYGYTSEEIVSTGLARYDGLGGGKTKEKRILIAPTWRTYLNQGTADYDQADAPNAGFARSDFYKIYSDLMQKPALLDIARRHGYTITCLVHPQMTAVAEPIKEDAGIEVVTVKDAPDYESLLNTSSLLVTDYSGLQFDFAYMYRPVLYFHHPKLPPSYNEAAYSYTKDALGEISTTTEDLLQRIESHLETDCKILPKYSKRVDEFFYFHDWKNCKRIYDVILKWQDVD